MSDDTPKLKCAACGGELPLQFFSRDRTRKSHHCRSKYCRACDSLKFKAWYQENRSRVIARVRANKAAKAKLVIRIAGEQHELSSSIDGKSPLRIVYELMQPKEEDEEENGTTASTGG